MRVPSADAESDRELAAARSVEQWDTVVRGVHAAQRVVLAEVARSGLPAQWFAVSQLLLAEPDRRLPMSRLAHELSMTSGGFTKLADRMAREGLIDRRGASADRRVIYAALTDAGLRLAREAARMYARAVADQVLGALTAEQLATMADGAGRLLSAEGISGADAGVDDESFVAKARPSASPERRRRGPS